MVSHDNTFRLLQSFNGLGYKVGCQKTETPWIGESYAVFSLGDKDLI